MAPKAGHITGRVAVPHGGASVDEKFYKLVVPVARSDVNRRKITFPGGVRIGARRKQRFGQRLLAGVFAILLIRGETLC